MRERGYPVDDFDQQSADISVDHPKVVENYRAAHDIHLEQRHGEVSTERQRQAFVHYRALFETLLETHEEHDAHRMVSVRTEHRRHTVVAAMFSRRSRRRRARVPLPL